MIWEYPLWSATEGITLKTNQILVDGEVIQAYPDNDGGLWYWDPKTGEKVVVRD